MEAEAPFLSILASAGDVLEFGLSTITTIGTTIAGKPILLLACVGIPLCGLGIGMFKRLLSSNV